MKRSERVATVDSEIEAQILHNVLDERGIPHVMRSLHDSAYDGIFQLSRGWGFVEAPAQFKADILAIVEELKHATLLPDDAPDPES